MLTPSTIALIERLHAAGQDAATIAAAAGCDRSTVYRTLARNRRPSPAWREPLPNPEPEPKRTLPVRCRGCGGLLVLLPCQLCQSLKAG